MGGHIQYPNPIIVDNTELEEVGDALVAALASADMSVSDPRVDSESVAIVALIDGKAYKLFAQEVK